MVAYFGGVGRHYSYYVSVMHEEMKIDGKPVYGLPTANVLAAESGGGFARYP